MMYPCEIKEQSAQPTLSIHFKDAVQDLPSHFGRVYTAVIHYLEELGEQHAGFAYAAYHNMDMQNLDVEAGFPVTTALSGKGEIEACEIPGGTYAICHYTGPYGNMGPVYDELMQFAEEKGYAPAGAWYEWYLTGPDVPPQELKTDIAIPVVPIIEMEHV